MKNDEPSRESLGLRIHHSDFCIFHSSFFILHFYAEQLP